MKIFLRNRNNFIKLAAAIFLISCVMAIIVAVAGNVSGSYDENKTGEGSGIQEQNREGTDEIPEETGEPDMPEIPYALESFGGYLEELYREGRKTELDSNIISTRLSLKDAALLAERSPMLEHIRLYEEDELTINTGGICILAADVNGDGLEDIIEYGPDYNGDDANMLYIYLGREDDGFELSYSQPLFDTKVLWNDIIEVARYEEETYLLFRERVYGDWWKKEAAVVTAYWLFDGKPAGKLTLEYKCRDISVTITENEGAYDVSFLEEHRMSLYHVVNYWHCGVKYEYTDLYGSGETQTFEWEDEETYEVLMDGYVEKYMAQQEPYVVGRDVEWGYNITGMSHIYESDLNNDGIMEKYLKDVKELWLYENGFPRLGYSRGVPYITGEYYGNHEGRHGLMYYVESEGEETDFLKMCGLDIWEGEMTPQYFWVEQTDRGNVTYIAYQDGDEYRQHIEGYLIQGDEYKRVVSADYIPQIECIVSCEVLGEESDGVDYIIHCAKDRMSFELEWNEENEQNETINHNIRMLLEEESGKIDFQGREISTIGYHPIEATKAELVVDCLIYPENQWEPGPPCIRILINLVTGECRKIDYCVIY